LEAPVGKRVMQSHLECDVLVSDPNCVIFYLQFLKVSYLVGINSSWWLLIATAIGVNSLGQIIIVIIIIIIIIINVLYGCVTLSSCITGCLDNQPDMVMQPDN